MGIAGCWAFWRYLLWVQPDVSIAPKIAVSKNNQTDKNVYRFKILNNGKRQVTNITFKAWICDLMDVLGGKVSRGLYPFPINNSETATLGCKSKVERPWGLTPETVFRSEADFDVDRLLLDPDKRILVTLRVSDALSGTTVVQQRTFDKNDFVIGAFQLGESFSIKP